MEGHNNRDAKKKKKSMIVKTDAQKLPNLSNRKKKKYWGEKLKKASVIFRIISKNHTYIKLESQKEDKRDGGRKKCYKT